MTSPENGSEHDLPSKAAPVAPSERIVLLDVLRGAALLGIFLVNFNKLAAPVQGRGNSTMQAAIDFCCDGSFYPLFSFLFGLGFALQIGRLESRGLPAARIYLRRLFVLLCIGLAHAVFLASGEVLRYYAVLGVPLLLIRRLPSWMLALILAACLLFTVKLDLLRSLSSKVSIPAAWTFSSHEAEPSRARELERVELRAYQDGGYWEQVGIRAQLVWDGARHFALIPMYPTIFAMFLAGLLASRMGVLQRPGAHLPLLRSSVGVGLLLGLVGSFVFLLGPSIAYRGFQLVPPRILDFTGVFEVVGNLGLSLFYGAGLILLVDRRELWGRWLAPLSPVGRMALTNFLMQSVIMVLIMGNYGLGLAFKLTLTALLPLKIVLFVGQVALSGWWMRRFRYGPAEWFWRAATYGSLPPFLLPPRSRIGTV